MEGENAGPGDMWESRRTICSFDAVSVTCEGIVNLGIVNLIFWGYCKTDIRFSIY